MARKRNRAREASEADLLNGVCEGVRSLGWMLPETESEFRETDDSCDEEPLPAALRDAPPVPRQARRQTAGRSTPVQESLSNPEIDQALARAAREGRSGLPPEIEERMRSDRARAEKRVQNNE